MSGLLADLTAPDPGPRRMKGKLQILIETSAPEVSEALVAALASDVGATLLSRRLHEHDFPISTRMIEQYRARS